MKAGALRTPVTILRKTVVEGDYKDKEVYVEHYHTRCDYVWKGGGRKVENKELFYSQVASITMRSYVDIEDEDHVVIDEVEYRVISINKNTDTNHNQIEVQIEKINK